MASDGDEIGGESHGGVCMGSWKLANITFTFCSNHTHIQTLEISVFIYSILALNTDGINLFSSLHCQKLKAMPHSNATQHCHITVPHTCATLLLPSFKVVQEGSSILVQICIYMRHQQIANRSPFMPNQLLQPAQLCQAYQVFNQTFGTPIRQASASYQDPTIQYMRCSAILSDY